MEQFVNMHTCFSACQIPTIRLSTVNLIHCDTAYSWQHCDKNLISYLNITGHKTMQWRPARGMHCRDFNQWIFNTKKYTYRISRFFTSDLSWSERYINKFGKKSARLYVFKSTHWLPWPQIHQAFPRRLDKSNVIVLLANTRITHYWNIIINVAELSFSTNPESINLALHRNWTDTAHTAIYKSYTGAPHTDHLTCCSAFIPTDTPRIRDWNF